MLLGGLAALLLSAADAGTTSPRPVRSFTLPEIIDVVEIPGEQKALGVPMTLKAVRTKLSLDAARFEVMKQFNAAGMYIPPAKHISQTAKEPLLVALDPTTLVAYTAIFQPSGKFTTVILGTSYLSRREKPGLPSWGPVFPGGAQLVVSDVEQLQAASYAVGKSEAEVRAFYEQVMPGGGFKKVAKDSWDRNAERISVMYSKDPDGQLRVLMTRQQTGGSE